MQIQRFNRDHQIYSPFNTALSMLFRILILWLICSLHLSTIHADSIRIESIQANGYTFNCRVAGETTSNKYLILLHGFPETSHMWESTMLKMAQKGYFCIAPDMRGYSPAARPKGIKKYSIDQLAKDIIQIAQAKNISKFHLIGHDWGAAVAWAVCGLYPTHIQSFIPMSVPHLSALAKALKQDKDQRKMSAYAQFFQLAFWPEILLKAKKFKQLKETCWYLSDEMQVNAYLSVFSQKRALTSCLNYYRKNWNKMAKIAASLDIDSFSIPTTFIWGEKDSALGATASKNSQNYIKGPYRFVILEASHWLIQEKEADIHRLILQHLENKQWFAKDL